MAELNLKQITEKLNKEFTGSIRRLVFWYDAKAEFAEDIDALALENARVLHLERDNQFYIKHFLECVDTETSYLVYAPFAKPELKDNHLADTLCYSKEFHADRASLMVLDLGCSESLKPIFEKYIGFFSRKERRQKFYELDLTPNVPSDIEVGIMSVLCKLKTVSCDEILRVVLTENDFENNKYLTEFEKYGLLSAFWEQTDISFGYADPKPTLEKLAITMFVTYLSRTITAKLPDAWKPFIAYKSGNNAVVYLDNLMNSAVYGESFEKISEWVYNALNADKVLRRMDIDDIVNCHIFKDIENIIINRLIKRLEAEDIGARVNGDSIAEVCENRRRRHFGGNFENEYYVIENAWHLLSMEVHAPVSGIENVVKRYTESGFLTDRRYRYFYYYYDKLSGSERFEKIRELVENVHTNEWLNKICVNWNREFIEANGSCEITRQINFFNKYIRNAKERVAVIISDAMRYEVGYSLFKKLADDEKCTAAIEPMQSVLPSYTRLGMAALLPHKTLELTDDFEVLLDGQICIDTAHRQSILQSYKQKSKCVQFDDLKNMNVAQLREVFARQEVVYVYHNQIDARGDKANTENEVFTACEEAVEEIYALIHRLTVSANTSHFIVTADHGFIYKRDNIEESDKISAVSGGVICRAKRYFITETKPDIDGVGALPMSEILRNDDGRYAAFPLGSDIFKTSGGGMNFVHGGSSPQEMLIPLIDVRTQKSHRDTTKAKIALITPLGRLTNLYFSLDFIQSEAVTDTVKAAEYKIAFVTDNSEILSNEIIYRADSKSPNAAERVFRLKFSLKSRAYSRSGKYYLVIKDDNGMEVLKQEVSIDIAFAGNFGF